MILFLIIALFFLFPATAAAPVPSQRVTLKIPPGELVHWHSPERVEQVNQLGFRANGQRMTYQPVTRRDRPTRSATPCRAYLYGSGLAARLMDCDGYFRIRAANSSRRTVVLRIRYDR